MAISVADLKLDPPIFLAPMAGITDVPSRDIAQLFSPGLVVSEMIASSDKDKDYFEQIVKTNLRVSKKKYTDCPTAIQIAGYETSWMSYAAKVIEFEGGELIDINMGCPAKKVIGKLAGSALMKDPVHALSLIETIVKSTSLPVTLKMRLGWDNESINAPMIAKSAENAGVQMITVHARTRNQFFKGEPNWRLVQRVKDSVSIPVIVNGDIKDEHSAREAINLSSADGIMIGRAAMGKPWLIDDLRRILYYSDGIKADFLISVSTIVLKHFHNILEFYGKNTGLVMFRKHLSSYLKTFKLESHLCRSLITENSISVLENNIKLLFLSEKVNIANELY